MSAPEPNVVDWLTLAVASLGTFFGTLTAVWTVLRGEREKIDFHIDWEWFGNGPQAELPFVYVHNRSNVAVNIVELTWFVGAIVRRSTPYTAKWSEDPGDVNFPYNVAPGGFIKLFLDFEAAKTHYEVTHKYRNFFGFFRRSSLWLAITTMRGKRIYIGAERALPWRNRPKWLRGKED